MGQSVNVMMQVNLVVRDFDASLAFYRRLGLEIPDGVRFPDRTGPARHTQFDMSEGLTLELDTPEMAQEWHTGWRDGAHGSAVILGVRLPSRQAVDDLYAGLTAEGYVGCQPPYDAMWGARYAIVEDPDGNDVGLMSPVESE